MVIRPAGLLPWIYCKALQRVKKAGHLLFTTERPGSVLYRETLADEEVASQLVANVQAVLDELADVPAVTPPPALSHERLQYLFRSIRAFVHDEAKDIVALKPEA